MSIFEDEIIQFFPDRDFDMNRFTLKVQIDFLEQICLTCALIKICLLAFTCICEPF